MEELRDNPINSEQTSDNQETTPRPKRKRVWWRVLLKWIGGIVLGIIALLLLLTILLYIPAVQNWVVSSARTEVGRVTGLDIQIGHIRIAFPVKLKIENVTAHEIESGKMVADVGLLTANVSILPIIKGGNVPISGILLERAAVDLALSGDSVLIVGNLGELKLNNLDIEMSTLSMSAGNFKLQDAHIGITILTDTVPSDKPESQGTEMVVLFGQAHLKNVSTNILLLPDTAWIKANVINADFDRGEINLKEEYYLADFADIVAEVSDLPADINFLPFPWRAEIKGNKIRYGGSDDIQGNIKHFYYKLGDGWEVRDASMKATKDESRFVIEDIDIELPESKIQGYANLPFSGWVPDSLGWADLHIYGNVNPEEIKRFVGFIEGLPNQLIDIDLKAQGTMEERVDFDLKMNRPELINLRLDGFADQFFSTTKRRIDAEYHLTTGREFQSTLLRFMHKGVEASAPSWSIPAGLQLDGKAKYNPSEISADFSLIESLSDGTINANAYYRPKSQKYKANLLVNNLDLQHFLPRDTIGTTSATIQLEGKGTDLYSPKAEMILFAQVDSLSYKETELKEVMLLSQLKENKLFAALDIDNQALKLTAQADATLLRNNLEGAINIFVDTVILSQLGFSVPILESGKMELRSSIRSDLKEYYDFYGEIENFVLVTDKAIIRPTNTYITAKTSSEAIDAKVSSGDLTLKFAAQNGLNDFSSRISRVIEEVQKSLGDSIGQVNMASWIDHYPDMDINFSMGRNNLLRAYLDEHRLGATSAQFDLNTKTGEGLSGLAVMTYLQADTFRIDNVDLVLRQDSSFFTAVATIHKERFRNQQPFDILMSATSNVRRSDVYLHWRDSKERDFIQLGVELWNQPNRDLTFGFTPDPIVLAYNRFEVMEDDYITLPAGDRNKIKANLKLTSPEGAVISIQDVPDNRGHLLRANINQLLLSQLDGVPLVPDLKGILDVHLDWLQRENDINDLTGRIDIENFFLNQKKIGTLKVEASALDSPDGSQLDALAYLDGSEVIIAEGFAPKGTDKSRFRINIEQFPLDRANPFLPERFAQLSGFISGNLSNYNTNQSIVTAPTLAYSGELRTQDAQLFVELANEMYRFDNKSIRIADDKVYLENYALIANEGRLVTNGHIGLSPTLPLDIKVVGKDILLLNSTQTRNTMIFGRVNTDADLWLHGPASAFALTGSLSLKGDTDVTYQSQRGELQMRNGYKGLINFTDFSDTLFVARKSAVDSLSLGGLDIRLAVHIDPAAQINAILTQDQANKFSIQGGGDFNLSMPPYGAMTLNGTYNILEGDILLTYGPVARKFTIKQGSQIVWNGPIMEPNIDVEATSRVRTNVSLAGEPARQVEFDVSIIAENSLDNLVVKFVTDAPQDLTMRNTLAGLSPEEQNRQSIMLLTTGHYFGGGGLSNTRGYDVNSAITSMLASQLNSLAGEALDAEINFGISDGTNAYGQGTNYSYSITKRFFNNRISVQVGGKMVTGAAAQGLKQTFIDNMSLDYRLDNAGTHYLRLFHNKNYENLLDGEVIETGVGYVIRRRLNKLTDLFKFTNPFRSSNEVLPPEEQNKTTTETPSNEE